MIEAQLDSLFAAAGHRGRVCVLEIDGPGRVALHADEPTYAASAFKIVVGLELWLQCVAGELDPAEPVRISPAEHTLGGQGLCLFEDRAELSLRDLARLMLTISDNRADRGDGRRYAVAILTTTLAPDAEPRDLPIGTAARMAIEHLRQSTI